MLAIPLQRGDCFDSSSAFKSFIKSQYESADNNNMIGDVAAYQQFRDSALSVNFPTENGYQSILKFHFQLQSLGDMTFNIFYNILNLHCQLITLSL